MSQDWLLRPASQPIAPDREITLRSKVRQGVTGGTSFQEELNKCLAKRQSVTFSGHALERLRLRNIKLTQDDINRLENAIDKVAAKGGRESLVVYKDTAYVISVKNRTVITAVDSAHMNDHVFTQIDSAVFA
jgi:flagellar operon protein